MEPLGTLYNTYTTTKAINEWVLDPHQYSITKFKFSNKLQGSSEGLIYSDVDLKSFDSEYDLDRRSSKDISALSYRRFTNGNGDFEIDNKNLWYHNNTGGAKLNVQEPKHIILTESQRGGLNTSNLVKYSSLYNDTCGNFNYNNRYSSGMESQFNPYVFDSEYCKKIKISNSS